MDTEWEKPMLEKKGRCRYIRPQNTDSSEETKRSISMVSS
jgi:hypothetical protein